MAWAYATERLSSSFGDVYSSHIRGYGRERDSAHTQNTALKGRKFESIEAQNEWLAHWEERWAASRIHGRKKRQVLAMYAEERPAYFLTGGLSDILGPQRM
jgi:hypothetical protein